jgi:hypothetical protein
VNDIISWLTHYSPPVVLLLALGGIFIFVSKLVTESAISAQFEQYKKEVELRLQRRSNFEERVLLDRYILLGEIHTKIGRVMTDLNRAKSGTTVEGLFQGVDIVPLTSVFELIEQNRYLITGRFRKILRDQAELAIKYANTQDAVVIDKLASDYMDLDATFDQAMNEVFGLDRITWETRDSIASIKILVMDLRGHTQSPNKEPHLQSRLSTSSIDERVGKGQIQ